MESTFEEPQYLIFIVEALPHSSRGMSILKGGGKLFENKYLNMSFQEGGGVETMSRNVHFNNKKFSLNKLEYIRFNFKKHLLCGSISPRNFGPTDLKRMPI